MMVKCIIPNDMTSVTNAEVAKIFFKKGDFIKESEIVMKLETEKTVLDEQSPVSGIIDEIYVKETQIVEKNTPLYSIKY
jgi:pyruvate/2-oxoglutarate dehydrogenase complex dihydrolipoamide acyltransferase (E2) component